MERKTNLGTWLAISALVPSSLLIASLVGGSASPSSSGSPDDAIAFRAKLPDMPPGVVKSGPGIMYTGLQDKAHIGWLKERLAAIAAAEPDPARRRAATAFRSLQGREGSTAAINTYDNQIVTWGTGWSGKALLGAVMSAMAGTKASAVLAAGGIRYLGNGEYSVIDASGKEVRGKNNALEVIRSTPDLVKLLVFVARDPATRDDVLRAQLAVFRKYGGAVEAQNEIATQALFNFVAHLRHWAQGYAQGALAWAAKQVPGAPSPSRDVKLAEKVLEAFYSKAKRGGGWVPSWKQAKQYWGHMVEDALAEAAGHPLLAQADPPGSADLVVAGAFGQVTAKRQNAEAIDAAINGLQADVSRLAPKASYALAQEAIPGTTVNQALAETIAEFKKALEKAGAALEGDAIPAALVRQFADFRKRWADFYQRAQAKQYDAPFFISAGRDFGFAGTNVDEILGSIRDEYDLFRSEIDAAAKKSGKPPITAPRAPVLIASHALLDDLGTVGKIGAGVAIPAAIGLAALLLLTRGKKEARP